MESVGSLRAQSSLEFLYSAILMLTVFGMCIAIFLLSQSDVAAFTWHTEATSACRSASAQIVSVASSGAGAHSSLLLPPLSSSYTLRIDCSERLATISGSERSISCPLALSAVWNGTSAVFYAQDGTSMSNTGEVVLFG